MAASSSSSESPLHSLMHMITIQLSSTNFLLWKTQLLPVLASQKLMPHIDGTARAPPPTIDADGKQSPNPAYAAWVTADQKAVIILQASLSEEAVAEIIGLSTARQIWCALECAYSSSSIERVQNLKDQLRLLTKGTSTISKFGRKFKVICDQLPAIGEPMIESNKIHHFLCGLGISYVDFSTATRSSRSATTFRDVLTQAEAHELFLKSIHGSVTPPVAFTAETQASQLSRGHGNGRGFHGGRGRGRRPPHCQLCRTDSHFTNACPHLPSYASHAPGTDVDLAKAFHTQCHVTNLGPDWFVDSDASDHMSSSASNVSNPTPYLGKANVSFGNGSNNEASSSSGAAM